MSQLDTKHSEEEKYDEKLVQPASEQKEENSLHRALSAEQISMIAIGGAIGTGLVIGSGTALARSGPVGILLGYMIMGAVCFGVMTALGEFSAYLPHRKGFGGYATRFIDPAAGFAVGWNYLFKYWVVTANNLVAASLVVNYWPNRVPQAAWLSIFTIMIILSNFCGVAFFGKVEYAMSLIKIIVLTGLIIMCIAFDLGGGQGGPIYWRNWGTPFATYLLPGALGRFTGFWSVLGNALFAYIGTELIGVTIGEVANPRKAVPKAVKSTFFRIAFFYIFGVFSLGLVVPSNAPGLLDANRARLSAAASPFVVAANIAGVRTLPSIINGAILIFVFSAANSDLYIGSRTLYALALEGHAPKMFTRVNRMGVPYVSLTLCSLFCLLSFLSVSTSSTLIFSYFVSSISIFGGLTWLAIFACHIRFMKAMKIQGIPRSSLPYIAPFQPYLSIVGCALTALVVLTKGFDTFIRSSPTAPSFNYRSFITNYIGIPTFFGFFLFWKLKHRTEWVPLISMDLTSGVREYEEEGAADDAADAERIARTGGSKWYQLKMRVRGLVARKESKEM